MKKWVVIIGLLVLAACSEHDDILPPIEVTYPPTPADLTVESSDLITYHLTWTIDSPEIVKEYRIYSQYATSDLVLEGATDTTDVYLVSPAAVEGIVFCVSAVTIENVESHLVCGSVE